MIHVSFERVAPTRRHGWLRLVSRVRRSVLGVAALAVTAGLAAQPRPAIVTTEAVGSFPWGSPSRLAYQASTNTLFWTAGTYYGRIAVEPNAVGVQLSSNDLQDQMTGLVAMADGRVFVSDYRKVYLLNYYGSTSVVAGGGTLSGNRDAMGTSLQLWGIADLGGDAAGNLYLADQSDRLVRVMNRDGFVVTLAGSTTSSTGIDGPRGVGNFYALREVEASPAGEVLVIDGLRIRRVLPDGSIQTLAGSNASSEVLDGTGVAARFADPRHLTFDAAGNAYVFDQRRLRRISPNGEVTTLLGAVTPAQRIDGVGAVVRFSNPSALTLGPEGRFVTVDESYFRWISPDGAPAPAAIEVSPVAATGLLGGSHTFSVTAWGTPAPSYQWFKNGQAILGATNPALSLNNLTSADAANYRVTVANELGAATSADVALQVQAVSPNDSFAGASPLTAVPVNASADYIGSGRETGEPAHNGGSAGGSLWWSFTAPANGFVRIDVGASTTPSVLKVYTGNSVGALTPVPAIPAYAAVDSSTRVTFAAAAGTTYRIVVERAVAAAAGQAHLAISYAQVVSLYAGSATLSGTTNATSPLDARFTNAQAMARDAAGNLYVADGTTIRKITPAGVVSNFVTGVQALGMVFDSSGNLIVADPVKQVIRRITPAGAVSIVAGAENAAGHVNATGGAARFNWPYDVAIDASNNVYVADQNNHVIRRITPAGAVTTLIGTLNQIGSNDGVGAAAQLYQPRSLVVVGTKLFFMDTRLDGQSNRVRVADLATLAVTTLADGRDVLGLTGVALRADSVGNLYHVADYAIRRISPSGQVSLHVGNGNQTGGLDAGDPLLVRAGEPEGIVLDPAGNLYYTARTAIYRAAATSGNVAPAITVAPAALTVGEGSPAAFSVTAYGGPAVTYQWRKNGTAITGQTSHMLTFAAAALSDAGNYSVTVTAGGTSITTTEVTLGVQPLAANDTFAAAPVLSGAQVVATGQNYGASRESDEPVIPGALAAGHSVWWSWTAPSDGTIVAQTVGSEIKNTLAVYAGASLGALQLLAQDDNATDALTRVSVPVTAGTTYRFVVDGLSAQTANQGALRLSIHYGYAVATAGGAIKVPGPFDAATLDAARFGYVNAMARDTAGNVYFYDSGVVRRLTPAGESSSIAGMAYQTSSPLDGTGSAARIVNAGGMAVASNGNLYLVDVYTVRQMTPDGVVTTIAGTWSQSGSTDGTGAAARFSNLKAIVAAPNGSLYVADQSGRLIRRIVPSTGVVTTVAGATASGQLDGVGTAARFNGVEDMAIGPDGMIYLADMNGGTIRRLDPADNAVTTLAGGAGKTWQDGAATAVALSAPHRLAFDPAGNLYLYERGQRVLRRLGTDGQLLTLAGSGLTEMRDGAGLGVGFSQECDFVVNNDGSILISSPSESVLRRAEPSTTARSVAIVAVAPSRAVVAGTTVELFANVVGTPTPTFVWKRNGTVVPGAIAPRLVLTAAQPEDTGDYTLEATQGGTTAVSSPISLRVYGGVAANDNFAARTVITGLPVNVLAHNFNATAESDEPAHIENNTATSVWFTWTAPTDGTVRASTVGSTFSTVLAIYTGETMASLSRLAGAAHNGEAHPTVSFDVTAGSTYQIVVAGRSNLSGEIRLSLRYALTTQALPENPQVSRLLLAPNGDVYFTDSSQRLVRRRSAAGDYTTIAGIAGTSGSADGPLGQGTLSNPAALTRASDGTLYVVDGGAIRRVARDGTLTTLAGSTNQFGYVDAAGATARFSFVNGLALNADETALIIADGGNVLLRRLDLATNAVTTFAGTQNSRSAPPGNGVGAAVRLLGPNGMVRASDGMLFFIENGTIGSFGGGSAVRSLAPSGDVRTVVYFSGARGYASISLDEDGNCIVPASDGLHRFGRDGRDDLLGVSLGFDTVLLADGTGWTNLNNRLHRIVPADFVVSAPVAAPALQSHPVSVTVFPEQSAYFNVQATGANLAFQWQRDGVDLPGANAATLHLASVGTADAGAYRVVVSNSGGTVTSNSATLTLGTGPANDTFANALALTGAFAGGASSTVGATSEAGEPQHAGNGGGASVWWTWTAPASGAVIVDTSGSTTDTAVAVYTGDSLATLTEIASGQQTPLTFPNWRRARATFTAIQGTTYRIAVDSVGGFPGDVAVHVAFAYSFSTLAGLAENSGTADGTGSAARFKGLNASAVGPDGSVYVADLNNHTIRKVTPAGVVTTLAGFAGTAGYANGTGLAARFNLPAGIVYWNGFLYVADANNHAIRRVDPATGATTTFAGTNTAGTANGTGTGARFNQPAALAVDSAGVLYVAEAGNHAIRKITTPGAVVTTLAGTPGSSGAVDATGTAARFNGPEGVAVDANGFVYVADYGNRTLRKITSAGVVTTAAGLAGTADYVDGPATAARFYQPNGVLALADGSVLIADRGANSIRQLTPDNFVLTVAGGAADTAADGIGLAVGFNRPATISTDGQGRIYVTDQGNHTLRVGVLSSTPQAPQRGLQPRGVRAIAGTTVTLTGSAVANPAPTYQWRRDGVDVPGATSATLTLANAQPSDSGSYTLVATNNLGSLIGDPAVVEILPLPVNDSFANRSRILGAQVAISAYNYAATAQPGEPAHGDAPASRSTWFTWTAPASGNVTIDTIGTQFDTRLAVYRGDTLASLQVVAQNTSEAGKKFSSVRFNVSAGDVFQIAIDSVDAATGDLRLAINYSWNWALHTGTPNTSGAANGTLAQATFNDITAFASDASGNLYVAEANNHVIRRITPQGQVSVFAGTVGASGSTDGVGAAARFNRPFGLVADKSGNLYVADTDNHTVRKIVIATATVSTIAGTAGQIDYVDGIGSAARFRSPASVAVNGADELFVSDYGNRVIRKIALATNTVTTFAGEYGVSGNSPRYYSAPWGLAIDSAGNLFVADTSSIRKVLANGSGIDFAGDINGVTGFSDGAGNIARFNRPTQLAIDAQDNLYLADFNNNVVRQISPLGEVRTIGGEPARNAHNTGTATEAAFGNPRAIAIDAGGYLYVGTMMSLIDIGVRQSGPRAPAIATQPADQAVTSGGTASFLVVAAGQPAPTYQWRKNGTAITGATTALLTLSNVSANDVASYDVVITNANGSVTSRAASLTLATPPANDAFANATALTGTSATASGYPTAASAEASEPAHAGVPAARSLWWTWTAPATGAVIVETTGSTVDTRLAIYTGSALDALTLVAENDDATSLGGSRVQFNAVSGTIYRIAVDANGTATGGVRLALDYALVVSTFAGTSGTSGAANATGTAASFNAPYRVALDAAGNVFVADSLNHVIRRITTAGVVTTFAGSPGVSGTADGTGSAARFNTPTGLAIDAAGTLYVADALNHTIRKITSAGVVTTIAGLGGTAGSSDGSGTAARFNVPLDLAVDPTLNGGSTLVVVELGNHTLRRVTNTGTVTTIAGSAGATGSADGTGSAARFNAPRGVAVDNASVIYVADFENHTIRRITSAGVVTTLAGFAGSAGTTDGAIGTSRLWNPIDVAVDAAGRVLVAQYGGSTLRRIDADGVVTTLAGTGATGAVDGTSFAASFNGPAGLAVQSNGIGYLADYNGHTIRKFTPANLARAAQTITFAALPDLPFSANPITLNASATSGLTVVFSVVSGPASISGSELTLLGVGAITVRATQAGDASWFAADPVDRTFDVAANFDSWLVDTFAPSEIANTALTGPNADYDKDGLPNLVEYALGLNPKTASTTGAPTMSLANGNWTLTYTRPATRFDVTYAVQFSTNLTTWSTTGVTHALVSTVNGVETWRATYPASTAPTCFLRLMVTR